MTGAEQNTAHQRGRELHGALAQNPEYDADGRFGEPEELLGTLLYLLDNEQSRFVTGIVVPVDGGFSAYSGV